MTKPTTIRLPEELLAALDERARRRAQDRATLVRRFLQDGLDRDLEDEVVGAYRDGRVSLSEADGRLGLDAWEWVDLLRRRGETLSVQLEDWIDSRPLP